MDTTNSKMTKEPNGDAHNGGSALAMVRFVDRSPGLLRPLIATTVPGLPTLPDLKKLARDRRAAGHDVIDQSAGDIAEVGQPLDEEFIGWVEETRGHLLAEGHQEFARSAGEVYGYPSFYHQQYPVVTAAIARSWGVKQTPCRTMHTLSGRTAIDLALRGLVARAQEAGRSGPSAVILDTLAWSGYRPLADDLGLTLVHAPAAPGHGLMSTADGLAEAIAFSSERGLTPIGVITIIPSNPNGVGMERQELRRFVETAAAADLPVIIDAFYSPLAPEGHAEAVPLGWLESALAPEALAYLGVIVGETKVTSSQNKTSTLIWLAPRGHDAVAAAVVGHAMRRLTAINGYPRPQEALVAYALHTFPGGIHAAMGPRYRALAATRAAMQSACDAYNLPLSIGGSFYGTAALVDSSGISLIRDDEGRPVEDPRQVSALLISRYGLVGAPGGMFSPAPEASGMVRLTAAVTLEEVGKLRTIFGTMVESAR